MRIQIPPCLLGDGGGEQTGSGRWRGVSERRQGCPSGGQTEPPGPRWWWAMGVVMAGAENTAMGKILARSTRPAAQVGRFSADVVAAKLKT